MKTIGVPALLLLSLGACKKQHDAQPQTQTKKFAVAIQMESQRTEPQKAILIGSKSELEAAAKNKKEVKIIRVSDKNPVFMIAPKTGDTKPVDPVDPSAPCMEEIHAYYEAHYQEWLNQANTHCRDIPVCLSCPKANFGLSVLYVIQPSSPKCYVMQAELHITMTPFNFGEDDYDGPKVADFIQTIKM